MDPGGSRPVREGVASQPREADNATNTSDCRVRADGLHSCCEAGGASAGVKLPESAAPLSTSRELAGSISDPGPTSGSGRPTGTGEAVVTRGSFRRGSPMSSESSGPLASWADRLAPTNVAAKDGGGGTTAGKGSEGSSPAPISAKVTSSERGSTINRWRGVTDSTPSEPVPAACASSPATESPSATSSSVVAAGGFSCSRRSWIRRRRPTGTDKPGGDVPIRIMESEHGGIQTMQPVRCPSPGLFLGILGFHPLTPLVHQIVHGTQDTGQTNIRAKHTATVLVQLGEVPPAESGQRGRHKRLGKYLISRVAHLGR